MNPLQPTIGARTPVRIFWCLKVESEARRCVALGGFMHADMHTPVDGTHPMHTQAHVCVCSDSLNNNVLLPYWSSGYFSNIYAPSSCTFRENPLLLKISAAPPNSSLLTKTTSTLPRLIFQAVQDGILCHLEKDDNGLAECKFYYDIFSPFQRHHWPKIEPKH